MIKEVAQDREQQMKIDSIYLWRIESVIYL